MNTPVLILATVLAGTSGCSSDAYVYRDQPLVAKVATGMNAEQVQTIGGKPLASSERTVVPGTCFDYTLTAAGQQQPYSVSFDAAGKVDHKSFMTCTAWSRAQQKSREPPPSMGGYGGSGY